MSFYLSAPDLVSKNLSATNTKNYPQVHYNILFDFISYQKTEATYMRDLIHHYYTKASSTFNVV
jgi:hypothetical protein